jgi:hypothetical protein
MSVLYAQTIDDQLNAPPRLSWAPGVGLTPYPERVLEKEARTVFGVPLRLAWCSEPLSRFELTPGERRVFEKWAETSRQESWLRGRRALKDLLLEFGEPEDTSRLSFPNPCFSLTHTGAVAVAVGAPRTALLGLGIDLELRRSLRPDAARFFMRPAERDWLASLPESGRGRQLLRLWTVKEAVFKADPANQGRILSDYLLPKAGDPEGRARTRDGREIAYCSFWLSEGVLSLAAAFKEQGA